MLAFAMNVSVMRFLFRGVGSSVRREQAEFEFNVLTHGPGPGARLGSGNVQLQVQASPLLLIRPDFVVEM